MLWSLKMSFSKKLRVLGILGAGGLATGFSIWRLVMMVDESRTPDTTWFWIHCVLTGYVGLILLENLTAPSTTGKETIALTLGLSYSNAEAGIGLICACLPTLSSYIVTRKLKSQSGSGSYRRNYELNSYNKLSSSNKKGSVDPTATMASFGAARTDEAYLFSTVEADVGREGSLGGSSQERERDGKMGGGGIQKDVVVEQSFEYVK
jgi:hypothetical protein